ncbi:MAG: hypothetical protein KAJ14_11835 [Candidatus Omnitrophica bacterium]|nr:hypothetical protein [Candidatus Omnitrophota bacterium]MCK5493790.1 hypothetical protein [Candidatus Omnitrophota bacterium]
MFKVVIFYVFVTLCLEGCATIKYTKQLLVLKDLADSQKEINKCLDEQEALFKKILVDIKNKKIELGTSKEDFLNSYGKPVLTRKGSNLFVGEILLYRYPKKYFNSEKVYFYFDRFQKLVDLEHFSPIIK